MHLASTRSLVLAAVGLPVLTALSGVPVGAAAAGHVAAHHPSPTPTLETVVPLVGPRGVAALGGGRTLVSEADGSFSLVIERRYREPRVVRLGSVPPTGLAPAIAAGRHGTVYLLTGGGGEPGQPLPAGAATLFRWRPGWDEPLPFANIAAYQASDPDPDNQADDPGESNPFGVAVDRNGDVLVADAAANDLLRVDHHGDIETVARLRPRTVTVPEGLPPETPPAGTPFVSEAVATSVTVDAHGDYYVGELRGFPATPGTSRIWKIRRGSTDAVCDPAAPDTGACRSYADGLTSIVDLAAGRHGSIFAVTLSKLSWLAFETGAPGAEVGGLFEARRSGPVRELFAGQLVLPGGADVADHSLYLTGPVFGPGALSKARLPH